MNKTDLLQYLEQHADELRDVIAETDGNYQQDYLEGCLDTTEHIISIVKGNDNA